ncbi:hypothetical protein TPADAL_0783a [Treponema pallidum subsp. pallidum DAL-1]|uniref:Uncharacterized protein n=2 Tax=Treponema pallidum TaxID=160 RepID=A0AAU8S208_TREPL|nr:hypothetical protein TPESAMD_0783a [Treponema pallidum subsp. pertenue str. SamoaD]AEZ58981.1 hypothetical protein TPECDC2_0783a [Treponema pallidum subsp. pertenue str. CDC2]AEZ60049.1 hypothetical protein TPEGAU_0783a [Treponema pallidum subsp. pertenue str. Gauthier]AEZ61109.1 hypothetical protein TPADAL_0783a [Treponema pallidum subsp. pallidum DAL-1]AGK84433.1 hypothetical protein TPFB_0783a [Treponema pallidum str. Fribourg-Blanc]AHN67442.1 hypothetical protein TPSea814_000783a [Trepo
MARDLFQVRSPFLRGLLCFAAVGAGLLLLRCVLLSYLGRVVCPSFSARASVRLRPL